ncbi:MAG: hypothetical protein ACRCX2_28205 [Paraclostridium sp.]
METIFEKINEKPITLEIEPKAPKGDPPYPAQYYRHNSSLFNAMIPPQSGAISIGDIKSRNYNSALGVSGNSMSDFRWISGQSSGAINMSSMRNSIMFKGYQTEYYKDHRSHQYTNPSGQEIDYAMKQRYENCLTMSTAMANALMSKGFNYIQDMGSNGKAFGAVRRIDSANVKNGDWQWHGFCLRWGTTYIRVYK